LRTHPSITGAITGLLGRYAVLAALFLAVGCSSDSDPTPPPPPPPPTDPAPDFSLRDVNPNSSRFDQMVSPRDYEGQVSAYYFGHAT